MKAMLAQALPPSSLIGVGAHYGLQQRLGFEPNPI